MRSLILTEVERFKPSLWPWSCSHSLTHSLHHSVWCSLIHSSVQSVVCQFSDGCRSIVWHYLCLTGWLVGFVWFGLADSNPYLALATLISILHLYKYISFVLMPSWFFYYVKWLDICCRLFWSDRYKSVRCTPVDMKHGAMSNSKQNKSTLYFIRNWPKNLLFTDFQWPFSSINSHWCMFVHSAFIYTSWFFFLHSAHNFSISFILSVFFVVIAGFQWSVAASIECCLYIHFAIS